MLDKWLCQMEYMLFQGCTLTVGVCFFYFYFLIYIQFSFTGPVKYLETLFKIVENRFVHFPNHISELCFAIYVPFSICQFENFKFLPFFFFFFWKLKIWIGWPHIHEQVPLSIWWHEWYSSLIWYSHRSENQALN